MNKRKLWLVPISLLASLFLHSSVEDYYPYKVMPSASNYGNTGIFEIPNARMMPEASLRFNFSSSWPIEYTSLTASPFNWFEATYRYAEIKNAKYGPSGYSGNQSLKDKGFDIKALIKKETYFFPAIAVGLRDLAGSGEFGSEYIVATKRYRNFDFSLGLGWGVLGNDNNISNPFGSLKDSFKVRNASSGNGGAFTVDNWFSGATSLIGGIEYDLQKYGLRFKLEYDTSNPDFQGRVSEVNSRLTAGFDYAWSKNVDFSAAFERGSQFRLAFRLKGNFLEDTIPKPKPKTVQRLNESQKQRVSEDNRVLYRSLNLSLRDESIYIQAASLKEEGLDLSVASSKYYSMTRPVGRAARIASALAPDSVEKLNIYAQNGDYEVAKFSIGREAFEKADNNKLSPTELLLSTEIDSPSEDPLYTTASFIPSIDFPEFNWSMSPALRHQIGGPEGFYLGQLWWRTDTNLKFTRNFALYSSFGIGIYDTFDDFNNPSQSTIPRVRSDIQSYLAEGKNNIERMSFEYYSNPVKDIYARFDLGLLEAMFGGFGGEVLYRPFDEDYAIGLMAHKVKQRGYNQLFSFRDYSTVTGHLALYYDFPYAIRSQLLIGKYLAGDKGATLDLSRRFKTGFTVGVFATKTNLSAAEFGEGSFDKGFYISVPTKLFYSDFRSGNISFGLHPLTKDGGAILNRPNPLIGILGDTNRNSILRDWEEFLK